MIKKFIKFILVAVLLTISLLIKEIYFPAVEEVPFGGLIDRLIVEVEEAERLQNIEIEKNKVELQVIELSENINEINKKNITIKAMDEMLKGRLAKTGYMFYEAGQKYKVNPLLMASIAIHETANGISNVLIKCNNVGGINRRKGFKSYGRYAVYPSIYDSINDMAKLLKENYIDKGLKDIESIGNKYCPIDDKDNGKYGMSNESWIPSVTQYYTTMKNVKELQLDPEIERLEVETNKLIEEQQQAFATAKKTFQDLEESQWMKDFKKEWEIEGNMFEINEL